MKNTQQNTLKRNTLQEQRVAGELELLIEDFGRAMRNANKSYIAALPRCQHDKSPHFTLGMQMAWEAYVEFCQRNSIEKA